MPAVQTTIVVAVHYKIDAEGDTLNEAARQAVDIAHSLAENGARATVGVSVESAQALFDDDTPTPTVGCFRYGHHYNPTDGRCNRCGAEDPHRAQAWDF